MSLAINMLQRELSEMQGDLSQVSGKTAENDQKIAEFQAKIQAIDPSLIEGGSLKLNSYVPMLHHLVIKIKMWFCWFLGSLKHNIVMYQNLKTENLKNRATMESLTSKIAQKQALVEQLIRDAEASQQQKERLEAQIKKFEAQEVEASKKRAVFEHLNELRRGSASQYLDFLRGFPAAHPHEMSHSLHLFRKSRQADLETPSKAILQLLGELPAIEPTASFSSRSESRAFSLASTLTEDSPLSGTAGEASPLSVAHQAPAVSAQANFYLMALSSIESLPGFDASIFTRVINQILPEIETFETLEAKNFKLTFKKETTLKLPGEMIHPEIKTEIIVKMPNVLKIEQETSHPRWNFAQATSVKTHVFKSSLGDLVVNLKGLSFQGAGLALHAQICGDNLWSKAALSAALLASCQTEHQDIILSHEQISAILEKNSDHGFV